MKINDKQIKEKVKKYHGTTAKYGRTRLGRDPFHQIESLVTTQFLEKHPPRRKLVLDAGGGPDGYTIEPAEKGFDVVLLNITRSCQLPVHRVS